MNPESIQKAISILQESKQEINELFMNEPGLTLRLNTVFNSLINGFNHTINQSKTTQNKENMKRKELKSVFGSPIGGEQAERTEKPLSKDISQKDTEKGYKEGVLKFKDEINEIIPTLLNRQADEILESVGELHLRGIAKTIGLKYEDVIVNIAFVESIQEQLAHNQKAEELKEANKEESFEELSDETSDKEQTEEGYKEGVSIDLIIQYKELFGKAPNKTWSLNTIQKRIAEKLNEN